MSSGPQSPMFDQFHAAKAEHPDALLFFRMGDFYELFFDDAEIASRVLGITLTSRNKGAPDPVPMAGVPVKAMDGYLAKLIRAGYRVAICEQVEDPKQAKGLVKREVVRVVTPGTLTEDSVLEERAHNYLLAVRPSRERWGMAWVDLSTGGFWACELEPHQLADEVARMAPSEVLLPEGQRGLEDAIEGNLERRLREAAPCLVGYLEEWAFAREGAAKRLREQFEVATLEGFDLEELRAGVGAAGALLVYLERTQRTAIRHLRPPRRVRLDQRMHLDRATQRTLELDRTLRGLRGTGTLLGVLDRTQTAMGSRQLGHWLRHPLVELEGIRARQAAVAALVSADAIRARLREELRPIADLERIASRLGTERATARDLVALGGSLGRLPMIRELLGELADPDVDRLVGQLEPHVELAEAIAATLVDDPPLALKEGGLIREGRDAALDELHSIKRDGTDWMARYQAEQIAETGIETLKVGYNRVFGYYIEISRGQASKAPEHFIRRQTLKNAERFITPELKEFEDQVLSADERIKQLEYELFVALRSQAVEQLAGLQKTAAAVASLDVLAGLAEVAREQRYVRPIVDDSRELEIIGGRHPVLDKTEPRFVPNDTVIPGARPIQIITGPNMAGKSTYIRQVALIVLLAQTGSFVPADRARVGLVDRIFTRIGSADELARGHSTFMVEMNETANILNHASARSLVVLDEVGRGTSTFDGVAIAWALTEFLRERTGARTLFATHYHELTDLSRLYPEVSNYQVAVREEGDTIVFLHRIAPGGTDRSYGIHVARLAGIPEPVVERASEILERLEREAPDPSGERSRPETPRRPEPVPVPRRRQASLLFDLYDSTLDAIRDLDIEAMTPDQALDTLRRLHAELQSEERV